MKKHDPIKAKVEKEWKEANGAVYIPLSFVVALPKRATSDQNLAPALRVRRQVARYERWVRRYERRMDPSDPLRYSIRHWEAKICGVATDGVEWDWFRNLRMVETAELCLLSRLCRREYNGRKFRQFNERTQ